MADQDGESSGFSSYLTGIVRLAAARVRHRILVGEARQTLLSVVGIAIAISLMLVVTSVGLGLAAQGAVHAEATDFWILPESGASSPVAQVEGTQLGETHTVTRRLSERSDVTYATPILLEIVQMEATDGTSQRLFLVGIIPDGSSRTVLGLDSGALQPGDPYFNDGRYNGSWTGEAVVSLSAAQSLNLSTGTTISPSGSRAANHSFTVTDIRRAQAPGVGQLPVVMVHLSEAQVVTGASAGDQADRILVDATDPGVRSTLEGIYPNSEVVTQRGLLAHQLYSSDLPLAMSLAAAIVAIVIGLLTIVTTVGFEFVNDAGSRAVMAAMGVTGRTRVLLLTTETVITALVGGLLGVVLWLSSVTVINVVGREVVAVPLAVIRPEMAVYGLAVAVGIGLLSLPYLLALTWNTSVLEALPAR